MFMNKVGNNFGKSSLDWDATGILPVLDACTPAGGVAFQRMFVIYAG